MTRDNRIKEAVRPWQQLIAVVWLLGIAILAWRGWWWPGILVLVGITLVLEGIISQRARKAYEQAVFEETSARMAEPPGQSPPASQRDPSPSQTEPRPYELLPGTCPRCGAAVRADEVIWTGKRSADCAFCGASLPLR